MTHPCEILFHDIFHAISEFLMHLSFARNSRHLRCYLTEHTSFTGKVANSHARLTTPNTISLLNITVQQIWAWLVLKWVTAW